VQRYTATIGGCGGSEGAGASGIAKAIELCPMMLIIPERTWINFILTDIDRDGQGL
jgi:hypothetical protein